MGQKIDDNLYFRNTDQPPKSKYPRSNIIYKSQKIKKSAEPAICPYMAVIEGLSANVLA